MTEAFSAYIKTIAAFTLFAAFAEMLMPESSFKKYIGLIMGVLLLTAMLKPMLGLFSMEDVDMEALVERKAEEMEKHGVLQEADYYEDLEHQQITNLYGQKLNEEISKNLEVKFGKVFWAEAEFVQDSHSEDYGRILAITVGGDYTNGEELKRYMAQTYEMTPDNITIEFDP